jgi:group I intron endonuclease
MCRFFIIMIGIYKITSPSNRVYIGQSINIKKRFTDYKYLKINQTKIFYSINKYGYENHKFEVIEECPIYSLNERERYWQDFYDVLNNGLNCRLTTTNDKSGLISEESRVKISKSRKGIVPNYKDINLRNKRISESLTGKKLSESHIKAMSIAQTGLKRSAEAIKKSVEARVGRKDSIETRIIKSENQKGINNSFSKQMLNTETGIYYDTAKDAAFSLGWSYNRFNHYINGRTKKKLPFIFI